MADTIIHNRCNQRCLFCQTQELLRKGIWEETADDDIRKQIRDIAQYDYSIKFTGGGEPTMVGNLHKHISYAKSLGIEKAFIETNGVLMSYMPYVEKLKTSGLDGCIISLHSHIAGVSDHITQAPGTFKHTIRGIENLNRANIPITCVYHTITKSNFSQLKDFIEHMHNGYSIRNFMFSFIRPIEGDSKSEMELPKLSEIRPRVAEALDYAKKKQLTVSFSGSLGLPLCILAGYEDTSDYIKEGLCAGNLLERYGNTFAEKCNDCAVKDLCPGVNSLYLRIHAEDDLKPIQDKLSGSIKRTRELAHDGFVKRVNEDLSLFKKAIEAKDNKNNIYDTYSHYLVGPSDVKDEKAIIQGWKRHLKKVKQGYAPDLLSFYIHIPFCESNCEYCCYPSTVLKKKGQVEQYVGYLKRQMDKFAPLFEGFTFKTLYIGGGTPSILSERQLKKLLSHLYDRFSFHEYGERSIELNPKSTGYDKLKLLKDYGFNKLSIGVQSLSEKVLQKNNREYQTEEMVRKTLADFKRLDMEYMNIDMLLGLEGDTVQDFCHSFERICKMKPSNICIYPMKTNDRYIRNRYRSFERFKSFYYPLFYEVAKRLPKIADMQGMRAHYDPERISLIAPLVFSLRYPKKSSRKDYSYTHFNLPPYSNFCLGFYSHSRIVNVMDYLLVDKNNPTSLFQKGFSDDPDDYIYISNALDPDFEKVKFIIKKFYVDWKVSRYDYKKMYGTDILDDFPYAVKALEHFGMMGVKNDCIGFKEKDEKRLYPYLLFFAGRENVMKKYLMDIRGNKDA